MSIVLLRLIDELTVNRVFFLELGSNSYGFIHLVTYNDTTSFLS